ncbi:MAG: chemotaxis response regulator protein-glutamate methylesterase [Acidobacteria bacterium]|nr:MAG: chemotaxis response regulator protein-glutamate methylesterase [Acidobacteriota bacterium]
MTTDLIRVLVVDDSALMRKLIPQLIERDSSIRVVGTAMDGTFALRKIEELKPDAITLDLEMPRMNGIETLRQIMRVHQLPVVVVSAHTHEGASAAFKALHMGAFDFVAKPENVLAEGMSEIADELIAKIKAAVASPFLRRPALSAETVTQPESKRPKIPKAASKFIAIGSSTGGPNSLEYLLSHLPADFPAAILVVQHMPAGFTSPFARRLNEACTLEVKEAQSGDLLAAGRVLVCPGDRHMRVRRMPLGDVVILSDEAKVNGHRPSVDVLFRSVAQEFGNEAIGLLMTGMGEDGAEGLGAMKIAGALTIAQDEASSVVFGMPRAAIERGYATRIVSLEALPNTLVVQCCTGQATPAVGTQNPVRLAGQM